MKQYPIEWKVLIYILHGEKDNLICMETISQFADRIGHCLL